MIGSITEVQVQMAGLEKRRKDRGRVGRDLRDEPEVAAADRDEADGQRAATETEHAGKATSARGFEHGPGEPVTPGRLEPDAVDRGYIDSGHAAESPQAGPARANPMPSMPHVVLPDMPYASRIPPAVIANFTMGSPSEK